MYCKRCQTLIDEDTSVCQKCNYDNLLDETRQFELKQVNNVEKTKSKRNVVFSITLIVVLLSIATVFLYTLRDSKAQLNENEKTTTKAEEVILNNTFIYNNFELNYPETFGTSSNTIFYKNNNGYNITINNINELEYNDIINSKELLEEKLGTIDTLTYASENAYSHIFMYNDEYYEITVNYITNDTLENITVQLEMSKIINTLHEKDA